MRQEEYVYMYIYIYIYIYIFFFFDAMFDIDVTSPISVADLSFQGTMNFRDMKGYPSTKHSKPITEETGPVDRNNESSPNITGQSYPTSDYLVEKSDS